ncbi:MAG: glycine oxidase ThiO [Deltaproteobacteria bacterium]|nr:glycine oxidase ThiO [Deltaproteobacteria bacterium]
MSFKPPADVAIVGGGIMGCVVALRLAQQGFAVTVVERGIPGAEASSAAAGILGPQWEMEQPGPLLDLGLKSRALYPAFAAELRELTGMDIGYKRCGLIEVALDEAGAVALRERQRWQSALGLRAEFLTGAQARELEPELGPGVCAGLYLPDEGAVNPRTLARALSQAAASVGVTFVQGHYVRRVDVRGERAHGVELDGHSLPADVVVVAAGSWSSLVEGGQVPSPVVRPARGQALSVQMRPPLFKHVIAPYQKGYLVPRDDGMAVIGSTLEMVGYRKEVTVEGLHSILQTASAVVPALGPLPITETWSNFRPYTSDLLPVLGHTTVTGLFLATGHHRYGILLAPITGELLAQQIMGQAPVVDPAPFSIARFAAL